MAVTVFDIRGLPVETANAKGKDVTSNVVQLVQW
jgi:hypothetical protein